MTGRLATVLAAAALAGCGEVPVPPAESPMSPSRLEAVRERAEQGLEQYEAPAGARLGARSPQAAGDGDRPVTDAVSGEVSVAADPRRPGVVAAAALDFSSSQHSPVVAVHRSTDGGRSFRRTALFEPPTSPTTTADPSLHFAPDGHLYLAFLQGVDEDSEGERRGGGIYVARSADGGVTWGAPVLAGPALDQGVCAGPDKPFLGTGPDPGGGTVVYVTWQDHTSSRPNACDGEGPTVLRLAVSRDAGTSFGAPVALSEPGEDAFGSMPRVLPDGTLLVSFLLPGGDVCGNGTVGIVVWRSADGGVTGERTTAGESCAVTTTNQGAALAANSVPVLAVDGDGRTAVAWVAGEPYRDDNRIEVRLSSDGGRTWRAAPPLAEGPPVALQQWLAHGPDGRLHLLFYAASPGGFYDTHLTTLGGSGWSAPQRLSSSSSIGAGVALGFGIGHYPGLDVGPDGVAYGMWSDAREEPASYAFFLWSRTIEVGGGRPAPAVPSPAAPGAPASAPPADLRVRVAGRVRRSVLRRRGLRVVVERAGAPAAARLTLVRGRRVLARRRLPARTGTVRVRLRVRRGVAAGRLVLRVRAGERRVRRVIRVR